MLSINSLSKSFGQHHILNDLNIDFGDNSLTAIIGPNGCGKSTLFDLITGQLRADSGEIIFDQQKIHHLSPKQIAKKGILRKFQIPGIYPSMTVNEHLKLPFSINKQQPNIHSIKKIAKDMHLIDEIKKPAVMLSGGQKQWLELAMLLLLKPKLLLLDEPISGMTHLETNQTCEMLKRLHQEGMNIICIEHNIHFVSSLTKDIAVLFNGKLAMRNTFDEIQKNPEIRSHYLGNLYF